MPYPGIYMPTGFTPNNDGLNDDIKPTITKEFSLENFSIYNRWGQKIFSTSQKNIGWNGKINGVEQNPGVYAWIINATDIRSGEKHDKKGTLYLSGKMLTTKHSIHEKDVFSCSPFLFLYFTTLFATPQ